MDILRQWTALVYRVPVIGFIGQVHRCLAHVQLAGHHVGDQAGAVFLDQVDLALGAVDGGVNVGRGFVEALDDSLLLIDRRYRDGDQS